MAAEENAMSSGARGAAIVVGGAVAKGAFAAGALAHVVDELQRAGMPIRALVGTSSGALNATVMAAGVQAGDPTAAARILTRMWTEDAGLTHVASFDLGSTLLGRGVSRSTRIIGMLEEACSTLVPPQGRPSPVALRIVVAPLAGVPGPRTSFEQVEAFGEGDFTSPEPRARMFRAAAASAAFPYAFEAVDLDGLGPCIDGGVVNNTPIKHAIDAFPDVGRVYVIVADPPDMHVDPARAARLGGLSLGLRIIEMLIDQRLVRDLAEARAVNAWLEKLDDLERRAEMTVVARREIVRALYDRDPAAVRRLELVEIRPEKELPGNPFSGFISRQLRVAYLEAGRRAAESAAPR